MERLQSKGEALNPQEATLYRALAARANYLALDRPDSGFNTEELCRDSSAPAKLTGMAAEMGALVLGIPESLGGVVEERSSVTAVLAMEALAHGDMGLAAAFMAPAEVPDMPTMSIQSSSRIRSRTPQVKAPCAPPPCRARSTGTRARDGFLLVPEVFPMIPLHHPVVVAGRLPTILRLHNE